mmetsp:Transcript_11376/g.47557  ORF Transcript_11376/g.47557 Transcript_11376/m.47557 type:complete len:282 (+) Transcript_11376:4203-5048(+)
MTCTSRASRLSGASRYRSALIVSQLSMTTHPSAAPARLTPWSLRAHASAASGEGAPLRHGKALAARGEPTDGSKTHAPTHRPSDTDHSRTPPSAAQLRMESTLPPRSADPSASPAPLPALVLSIGSRSITGALWRQRASAGHIRRAAPSPSLRSSLEAPLASSTSHRSTTPSLPPVNTHAPTPSPTPLAPGSPSGRATVHTQHASCAGGRAGQHAAAAESGGVIPWPPAPPPVCAPPCVRSAPCELCASEGERHACIAGCAIAVGDAASPDMARAATSRAA